MSAPDRIWHAIDRNGKISGCPDAHVMPCADVQEAYTEYVRADLCAPQDERVQALEAENARLREVLEFYGDRSAWNQPPVRTYANGLFGVEYESRSSQMQRDRGAKARAALRDLEWGE